MFDHIKTVDDALAAWDANEVVPTVTIGGLGPGYEQCCQILMFEVLRAIRDFADTNEVAVIEAANRVARRLNDDLQFSGAQVAASIQAARVFRNLGWKGALERAGERRTIFVQRVFPQWPRYEAEVCADAGGK